MREGKFNSRTNAWRALWNSSGARMSAADPVHKQRSDFIGIGSRSSSPPRPSSPPHISPSRPLLLSVSPPLRPLLLSPPLVLKRRARDAGFTARLAPSCSGLAPGVSRGWVRDFNTRCPSSLLRRRTRPFTPPSPSRTLGSKIRRTKPGEHRYVASTLSSSSSHFPRRYRLLPRYPSPLPLPTSRDVRARPALQLASPRPSATWPRGCPAVGSQTSTFFAADPSPSVPARILGLKSWHAKPDEYCGS